MGCILRAPNSLGTGNIEDTTTLLMFSLKVVFSCGAHNANSKQKVIFHLEAFVAKFMRITERYVD